MYLARRRGEEAMLALHHMAYIAQNHTQQPHTHEPEEPQHVGVCICSSSVSRSQLQVTACTASIVERPKARLQHDGIVVHATCSVFTSTYARTHTTYVEIGTLRGF